MQQQGSSRGTARVETVGVFNATTGTEFFSHTTTPHSKGAWAPLAGSVTAFPYERITLNISGIGGSFLVDLAIGASGSEQIIAADLLVHGAATREAASYGGCHFELPLHVPAGSQFSVRCAGSATVLQVFATVTGVAGHASVPPGFSQCIPLFTGASSTGVLIDCGASAGTKVRTQMIASSPSEVAAIFAAVSSNNDTGRSAMRFMMDLEMGGSGSEQIILPDYMMGSGVTLDLLTPSLTPIIPCRAPAGTRFSAKACASQTTAGDRAFRLGLYGLVP